MGSKSRIAKHVVPIIQKHIINNNIKLCVEPFCGGCNVIDEVICDKKLATDKHEYLIEMYKNLDKINTLPEFITKEHYSEVRDCFNKKLDIFPKWYIGAVGFLASYNGRFFDGGYAGIVHTKIDTVRNYYDEAVRNVLKQIDKLKQVEYKTIDYKTLIGLKNKMIYCDPPYESTTKYKDEFNHTEFWEWVRELSKDNYILISEYNAPEDFVPIWQKELTTTLDKNSRSKAVEKLFTHQNGLYFNKNIV